MVRFAVLLMTVVLSAWPLAGRAAGAENAPPVVVTDIAPVQGLVAAVMRGVGEPALIVSPGQSPHGGSLRPSQAAALADADLVFWIGPGLTPWLAPVFETLASGARAERLDRVPGTVLLALRAGVDFSGQNQAGDAHSGEADHDGDGHDHDAAALIDGKPVDPHLWLDPRNAVFWLDRIAAVLAQADPERAETYAANAAAARAEIVTLDGHLAARLAPLSARPFAVLHDAYRYFETRYGLKASGALTPATGGRAGPARVQALREALAHSGAVCLFIDRGAAPSMGATVTEGTATRVAELDPMGAGLAPGPGFYPALIAALGDTVANCLAP